MILYLVAIKTVYALTTSTILVAVQLKLSHYRLPQTDLALDRNGAQTSTDELRYRPLKYRKLAIEFRVRVKQPSTWNRKLQSVRDRLSSTSSRTRAATF